MPDSDSQPSSAPPAPSSSPKKVIFETDTTGDYWTDFREAVKRISFFDDLQKVGEIPCARSSLLSGIASGAGVGVIRGLSASAFVASNWAVGTFVAVTLGSWTICRRSRDEEKRRVQQVVEQLPRRFAKQQDDAPSNAQSKS
ncbi:uncharacterized protein C8Q71DRAFT_738634 [Rhodofomes roseus]|uniref:Cytochrome c oxidase assembly protein COX20, mitochondrial n=1 Tax=Rhodofomes roseus TaxID=34475 RepID=A0ABQ8KUK0_9APHY|nr:uncharacterized protein C8Q71DRAFT_738634 [Rhodofomes roseus]KAH9841751.1 hypothetical protein C8Q71DRAFT_738634 [Rhodofomes roseus]